MTTDTSFQYRLLVNGEWRDFDTEAATTLLEVLRGELGLTGTKYNCEQGECGACTVLVDGTAINSCIALAAGLDGRAVITIEGLSAAGELDPVQQSFLDFDASQCGYCTPGMIMAAKGLLTENPRPSLEEIAEGLEGNYCRCTGYNFILQAVHHAATVSGRRAPRGERFQVGRS